MRFRFCLVAAVLLAPIAALADGGFSDAVFAAWAEARTGSGDPVYWYSVGTMNAYPSGEVLAVMEGFDTARSEIDPETGAVRQYSRKIYIFRDPDTGAVLREVAGQKVAPIAYPYQFITYARDGAGGMLTTVEQGAGPSFSRFGPSGGMTARKLGDAVNFNAPVWLDFEVAPGVRYQAWENYDFFIQPEAAETAQRYQLSWVRYGALPVWTGAGNGVMQMTGWRVARFADLPDGIRRYVETEAPLWMQPPRGLEEIRALQSAVPDGGEAGFSEGARAAGQTQ